jgi:phosphatidate cytidylyltransferase
MLAKRTWSAILIALIGGLLIFFGGWAYTIGIALFLAMATWEFIHMFSQGIYLPRPKLVATIAFVITILRNFNDPTSYSAGLILAVFTVCAVNIWQYKEKSQNAAVNLVIELAAITFIAIPGSFLIGIRNLPFGLFWTLACVLPASLGDIGAFLIGSLLGKHKLSPHISPNKTVEGFLGGIFFAGLTGLILGLSFSSFQQGILPLFTTLIGLIIGLITPFGDLSKSIIKRNFSLKDTGNLIPGHGGMLDRIDTILWAAPITYFLIYYFG